MNIFKNYPEYITLSVQSIIKNLYDNRYLGVYIGCTFDYSALLEKADDRAIVEAFIKEAVKQISSESSPKNSKVKTVRKEKKIKPETPSEPHEISEIVIHNITLEKELRSAFYFSSSQELGRMLVAVAVYSTIFDALMLGD